LRGAADAEPARSDLIEWLWESDAGKQSAPTAKTNNVLLITKISFLNWHVARM
jgi:hypothetical protein